jgi:membrane protease subunit HflK
MAEYEFERRPQLDIKVDSRIVWGVLAAVVLLWLASGIYIVDPEEAGVVTRFGKLKSVVGPGPHWHIPRPFEAVETPKVTEVKRIEIGFRTVNPGPPARYQHVPEEALMLTGDENILDAEIIVQYQINDPVKYLFRVREQHGTVKDAAEAALRQVVGSHGIDEALTVGKEVIQDEVRQNLQQILEVYELGLMVLPNGVKLQTVTAPQEVDAAFKDVASAREDRERLIKEAEGYRNDVIPKARGTAEKQIKGAEAYKVERIKRSSGDVERFKSILAEYRKAPEVTRTRLFLETMETVLPRLGKYLMDNDGTPLLPILQLQPPQTKEVP